MELMIRKNDLIEKINKLKGTKTIKSNEEEYPFRASKNESSEKHVDTSNGDLNSEKTNER